MAKETRGKLLLVVGAFYSLFSPVLTATNEFTPPGNSSCACPNQELTFNCTVVGDGATVWTGSAFSCATNEILLRHSAGAEGDCNGIGPIRGRIITIEPDLENNIFTSQLHVTVSNDFNNKTVQCSIEPIAGMQTKIGEDSITVISAPIEEVPDVVLLTGVDQGRLSFNWNAVDSNCASIVYHPSSSCTWSCDNVTDTTTAVCSGLQLPSVCTFTVQTEVCGQIGPPSDPITVTLRVPDIPMVKIIPVYSGAQQGLLRIKANITDEHDSFNITDGVSVSVTSYSISFNSANAVTFARNTSCVENICAYLINVPSDLCQSSNDVSVALSASNRLGQGPSSDPTTIGCSNQFVKVEYDRTMSTITCRFLDETDTSVKLCTVMYGECGQELVQTTQGSSTMETPNNIVLSVDANVLECYVVTASSDLFTVIVDSGITTTERGTVNIAAIVVPIIIVALVLLVVVVLMSVLVARRRITSPVPFGSDECIKLNELSDVAMTDINEMELQLLPNGRFSVYPVNIDCELREFLKEQQLEFKRGCAFYEFVHDFERISEDQVIILMEEEQRAFSSFKSDTKHRLLGDKVPKPSISGLRVFVQSVGSGARHLPAGSLLLYEEKSLTSSSKPDPPIMPIISAQFKMITLTSTVTIKEFCQANKIQNDYSIFVEHGTFEKKTEADLIDVIIQDKEDGSLYSGPTARQMVQDPDLDKWRMFVLYKLDQDVKLEAGTNILHQAPGCTQISIENFHELTVDEDDGCMCMSDFVKQKAMVAEFTNGHAFYEFTKEEDLQCYKDVVRLPLVKGNVVVYMGIDLFYRLSDSGVPAVRVKPPTIKGVRVFIQSTSQGARCVKHGDTILYKKK